MLGWRPLLVVSLLSLFAVFDAAKAADAWPASNDKIPPGYSGPVFEPSFAFPVSAPQDAPGPWMQFDFRTEPRKYLRAVLAYVLEGMDTTTLRVQDNKVRKWYHVPWMNAGKSGREFTHGLTRERTSKPGELGPGLQRCVQNWAVGFYNPAGGTTLWTVWGDGSKLPDPSKTDFPVGTVAAKMQFTHATPEEVPFLEGSPTLQANINDPSVRDHRGRPVAGKRVLETVRLLNFDVAVRDARADGTTGWVFGAFAFNGELPGNDPWAKLDPIGLTWGNDPELSDQNAAMGEKPKQSIVLTDMGLNRIFGRGGRMNGLIDSEWSSCLSCHMSAQYPGGYDHMVARRELTTWAQIGCWFRNLKPGVAFGYAPTHGHSCGENAGKLQAQDYSLSFALALRAYAAAHPEAANAKQHPSVTKTADVPGKAGLDVDETMVIDGVGSPPIRRSGE